MLRVTGIEPRVRLFSFVNRKSIDIGHPLHILRSKF
jgi:hypothetical protein